MKTSFNKYLYSGFLLLGFFQVLYLKDYMQATASFGIALAFDPFNPNQKWNDRPLWQKVLLLFHPIFIAALFGLAILFRK